MVLWFNDRCGFRLVTMGRSLRRLEVQLITPNERSIFHGWWWPQLWSLSCRFAVTWTCWHIGVVESTNNVRCNNVCWGNIKQTSSSTEHENLSCSWIVVGLKLTIFQFVTRRTSAYSGSASYEISCYYRSFSELWYHIDILLFLDCRQILIIFVIRLDSQWWRLDQSVLRTRRVFSSRTS
jgi:hypothetical protein